MRKGILGFFISGRSFVEDNRDEAAAFCCRRRRSGLMPNEADDELMMARAGFTVVLDDFGLVLPTHTLGESV